MAKIKGNRNIFTVIGIILFFILISLTYFSPQLEGKQLDAGDVNRFLGGAQELIDYRKTADDEALWTNRMFGGMPAYLISVEYTGNLITNLRSALNVIPRPAGYLLLVFSFFFVLLLTTGVNPWISFAGALAFGFSSYFFVLMQAGHMSKVRTLAFMALVVAGVLMSYKKNRLWGSILAAVGVSLMLDAGHPQMTYYAAIMVLVLGITYFVYAIKEKTLPAFVKSSVLLVAGALLAVGTNFGRLYTTYEYGKYSTRGPSELTRDETNQSSGLDKDYILDYSYDIGEAMTAFIPRFKGGGMSEPLGEKSNVYQLIEKSQGKSTAGRIADNLPLYWGSQPIVGGPFYYGAVFCFLFVLSLFVVKGKDKWWLTAVVIISFLLSLGKNFSFLSNLMIDYFPAYNKFRDVKNIIVIQQFAMALLGVMAVREIYLQKQPVKILLKHLKYAFFITGGLAFLFVLLPGLAGNFQGTADAQLARSGWPAQLIEALQADRKMVLRTDAFRSFLFVGLAALGIWLVLEKKIKAQYAVVLWVALILADLWPVNKRYLNNDNFVTKRKAEVPFSPTKADEAILKDQTLDFRVLNISVNPFADAATSYFHQSVGGYHGAKMERYQEMIEHHISPEMQQLGSRLQQVKSQEDVAAVFAGLNAINMLNTRYVIFNPGADPLYNSKALGNAWFVEDVSFVKNADEEISALDSIDPGVTAVVDERFADRLTDVSFNSRAQPVIQLKTYRPNYLKYEATVENGTPLAVFSEIYYPKGWNAYIDGQPVEHIRTNYILRALPVPAGKHEIEFRFEPKSYDIGNKISLASSLILVLAVLAMGFSEIKKRMKHEEKTTGKN